MNGYLHLISTMGVNSPYYTPRLNEVEEGGGLFSPCASVCPSVDRFVSAMNPQQCSSDPFHICISYETSSENVSLMKFVSKCKKNGKLFITLSLSFWLGIQHDSSVWVVMGGRRVGCGVAVSTERRHSSCSSCRESHYMGQSRNAIHANTILT